MTYSGFAKHRFAVFPESAKKKATKALSALDDFKCKNSEKLNYPVYYISEEIKCQVLCQVLTGVMLARIIRAL